MFNPLIFSFCVQPRQTKRRRSLQKKQRRKKRRWVFHFLTQPLSHRFNNGPCLLGRFFFFVFLRLCQWKRQRLKGNLPRLCLLEETIQTLTAVWMWRNGRSCACRWQVTVCFKCWLHHFRASRKRTKKMWMKNTTNQIFSSHWDISCSLLQ